MISPVMPPASPNKGESPQLSAREPTCLDSRAAALRVLAEVRTPNKNAREAIDAVIERHRLNEQEAALATELVMGVIRHRLTLRRLLGAIAENRFKRIERPIQDILMLAAYQIVWLDRIPPFAAVNEAVEQAKIEGGRRAGKFANAVLRQLLRDIDHRRITREKTDPCRSIPIDADMSCQFNRAVLPDPADNPVEHLAWATSHPAWLVARWMGSFGREKTAEICQAGMARPPVFLRPNRLKTDLDGLIERLNGERIGAEADGTGESAVVQQAGGLTRCQGFAEGWFQPQDRTAGAPVARMDLRPGQVVLDMCAGLGTKSTQMAEIMDNRGTVLASDTDPAKLAEAWCMS